MGKTQLLPVAAAALFAATFLTCSLQAQSLAPKQQASQPATQPAPYSALFNELLEDHAGQTWKTFEAFLSQTQGQPAARRALADALVERALSGKKVGSQSAESHYLHDTYYINMLKAMGAREHLNRLLGSNIRYSSAFEVDGCIGKKLVEALADLGHVEDAWSLVRVIAWSESDGQTEVIHQALCRLTKAKLAMPPLKLPATKEDLRERDYQLRAMWVQYLVERRIGEHGVGYPVPAGDDEPSLITFLKSGDLKVDVPNSQEHKWFFRARGELQWKPLKSPSTSFSQVRELSISPGEKYLAVITSGEGHPALDLFELQPILKGEGASALPMTGATDLFNCPEFMGWEGERLRVRSFLDLTKPQPPEGKLQGEELNPPREYLLDVPSGKFTPAGTAPARNSRS